MASKSSIPKPREVDAERTPSGTPRVVAPMSYLPRSPDARTRNKLALQLVTVGLIASLLLSVMIALLGR